MEKKARESTQEVCKGTEQRGDFTNSSISSLFVPKRKIDLRYVNHTQHKNCETLGEMFHHLPKEKEKPEKKKKPEKPEKKQIKLLNSPENQVPSRPKD